MRVLEYLFQPCTYCLELFPPETIFLIERCFNCYSVMTPELNKSNNIQVNGRIKKDQVFQFRHDVTSHLSITKILFITNLQHSQLYKLNGKKDSSQGLANTLPPSAKGSPYEISSIQFPGRISLLVLIVKILVFSSYNTATFYMVALIIVCLQHSCQCLCDFVCHHLLCILLIQSKIKYDNPIGLEENVQEKT